MTDDTSRSNVIINAAVMRADIALREARRALFGDEEYEADLRAANRIDIFIRHQTPAPPEVRKKLIPNWARKKWLGGR